MALIQAQDLFTITHQSDRQIKLTIPSLFNNLERASILQTVLLMRDAIKKVEIRATALKID